jgi:hypothetical protein
MSYGELVMPDTPILKLSGTVGSAQYDEKWALIVEDFVGAVILVYGVIAAFAMGVVGLWVGTRTMDKATF